MKRTTHWMILGVYYFSQLLGIVTFSYDYRTGKVKTKLYITIYCAILSLSMFGVVPLMFNVNWKPKVPHGPDLHYIANTAMCLITVVAILISVLFNWLKRKEFIKTLKDFQHFRCKFLQKYQIPKKLEENFESSIRSKFSWGFLTIILLFLAMYDLWGEMFNLNSHIIKIGMGLLMSILSIIMTHYYFATMQVNLLLAVLNVEVKKILNASAALFKRQRLKQIKPGAFITQCCQLADDLDYLAVAQYNLLQLTHRINDMYEVQGACAITTIYLNNISVIYMAYMMVHHEVLYEEFGQWVVILMPCALIFYYVDVKFFTFNIFNLIEFIESTGKLLKNRQPWLPTLDERFEKSLKDFSLQLASFPLNMKLAGLFDLNRPMVFAVFASTITNAIVLIQYDYKNNNYK